MPAPTHVIKRNPRTHNATHTHTYIHIGTHTPSRVLLLARQARAELVGQVKPRAMIGHDFRDLVTVSVRLIVQ
ncbi:MAG: hypothetical protein P4L40_21515 [Terracidiphilus sp.]|nr:hypothetical protein [Terracidiphilus sp.]